ncbi:hypothetical protein [Thiospirillum jenense]|uniref:Uncharacterized protein n=1 Tax=Thiospirillum jenense TaxID=1653858 RepID=A0A839HKJ4_9GAMM|nr:hypothetical protein [Thiospirillum jenense]MBB1126372.1 hypothetical protein [Thiospirillum jenense]
MFESSISQASDSMYLGNIAVVDGLVRQFVSDVMMADDIEVIYHEIDRLGHIFSGDDAQYTAPNGWLTLEQLGALLITIYQLEQEQSLFLIVRSALASFASELMDLLPLYADDERKLYSSVDRSVKKLVFALLGISYVNTVK